MPHDHERDLLDLARIQREFHPGRGAVRGGPRDRRVELAVLREVLPHFPAVAGRVPRLDSLQIDSLAVQVRYRNAHPIGAVRVAERPGEAELVVLEVKRRTAHEVGPAAGPGEHQRGLDRLIP